jgi:hypothetical protein
VAAGHGGDRAGSLAAASNSARVAETDRTGALMSAFTTEHFALEGRRASTITESSARAALCLGSVSSGVLTLSQRSHERGGGFREALFPSPPAAQSPR